MQSASSSFRVIDDDDSDVETYSNASINARNRRRQEQLNASEFTVFIENFEVDINSSPINQVIKLIY
jgi:cytidylate kinase